MNRKKNQLLAFPYIFWMAGFTIIPLLMMLYYGLTNREGAFTLENILAIGSPEHLKALVLSLILAAVSTLICLLLAYPLALILRNRHIGQGSFIVFIFILPMWMNFLLRTMAWQTLLEKNGVINALLSFLHLPPLSIINTPAAIILGMVYNFLPFMVLPIYNALVKIEDRRQSDQRRQGSGGGQLPDLDKGPDPVKRPRRDQRHYHGVRTGPDHLRDLQPFGRQQDPLDRKRHRAGIYKRQQLESGRRAFHRPHDLHPAQHDPDRQI